MTWRILCSLSLALNAVLLGAFVLHRAAAANLFRAGRSAPDDAVPRSVTPQPRARLSPFPVPASPASGMLDARDFPDLVARLRAAGTPPTVVQSVVTALVDASHAARRAALRPPVDGSVYWKVLPFDATEGAADRRALANEHRKLLRDVLGPDMHAAEDAYHPDRRLRQFGQLPAEKVTQVRKLFADYDEMMDQAFAEIPSRVSPEGRAKTALLEREKRADLGRLLSPDELLAYDLRNSPSANALRGRLGSFDVSEAEFRALFPAQQAADAALAGMTRPFNTPEKQQQRAAVEQQLETGFRRALGEVRYAEFQRANNPDNPPSGRPSPATP